MQQQDAQLAATSTVVQHSAEHETHFTTDVRHLLGNQGLHVSHSVFNFYLREQTRREQRRQYGSLYEDEEEGWSTKLQTLWFTVLFYLQR
ncbi:hypothetical protein HaLaN_30894, partial [Haematococcus lacustris]